MSWAAKQRLKYIDESLAAKKIISRKDIQAVFDVGPATATRDFSAYKELAPENIVFNDSKKAYERGENFKRKFRRA